MRGRSRILPLALALLLALTPTVAAGTRDAPDIVDAADRNDAAADLRAAWLHATDEGARFGIQVEQAGPRVRDHVYFFRFELHGEVVFAAVGFGSDGVLRGHLGTWNGPDWDRGGFERVANGRLLELEYEPGAPATFEATIPWGSYDNLEPGATVDDLAAGTAIYHRAEWGYWSGGWWEGGYDDARADHAITLSTRSTAASLLGAGDAPLPWMLGLTLVGGALGGAAAALHHHRRAGSEAAATRTRPGTTLTPTEGADARAEGARRPSLLAGGPRR